MENVICLDIVWILIVLLFLRQENNDCGWIIWDSLLGFSQSSSLLINGEHFNEVGILQRHLYIKDW